MRQGRTITQMLRFCAMLLLTVFISKPIALAAPTLTEYPIPSGDTYTQVIKGPDNNLWFTDEFNTVARRTSDGTITEFNVPSAPLGITVGSDNNIWVFQFNRQQFSVMDTNGNVLNTISSSYHAEGITTGPDGNIWGADPIANAIVRTTPSGTETAFTTGLTANSQPFFITTGPDGNLWFTEDNADKIGCITTSGAITEFSVPTTNSGLDGITLGTDGNLWFTEYNSNKIGRITATGTVTEFDVPTANSGPYQIVAGPDNNLWFTENNSNQVGAIKTDGTIVGEYATADANSSPGGIAVGADNNVWFTEAAIPKIGSISGLMSSGGGGTGGTGSSGGTSGSTSNASSGLARILTKPANNFGTVLTPAPANTNTSENDMSTPSTPTVNSPGHAPSHTAIASTRTAAKTNKTPMIIGAVVVGGTALTAVAYYFIHRRLTR
jgi:streptogramin lyase